MFIYALFISKSLEPGLVVGTSALSRQVKMGFASLTQKVRITRARTRMIMMPPTMAPTITPMSSPSERLLLVVVSGGKTGVGGETGGGGGGGGGVGGEGGGSGMMHSVGASARLPMSAAVRWNEIGR